MATDTKNDRPNFAERNCCKFSYRLLKSSSISSRKMVKLDCIIIIISWLAVVGVSGDATVTAATQLEMK